MNEFHELNIMTSRGDIQGAFSLIRNWHENVARKIMKKAGYTVTPHTGRAFWTWVQETLSRSARKRTCGYRERAEREAPVRRWRQQAAEDYHAYTQMMSQVPDNESSARCLQGNVVQTKRLNKSSSCRETNTEMKTEQNMPGNVITSSEADVSEPLNAVELERISNATLRRNVAIVWSVCIISLFIPSVSCLLFTGEVSALIDTTVVTLSVFLLFLILFWTGRLIIMWTDKPFSTAPADSKLYWLFCHDAYRPGRYVGIRLCADITGRPYHKWVAEMAKFVVKEPCTLSRPLILRSHLLSNRKFREPLTKQLMAAGMCCSIQRDLPVLFPFLLKWFTPAVMVLGGKLPSMYAREVEIIVTPEYRSADRAASAVN
ncbi:MULTISPECIES: hypothetical protein [unclassified Pantoea]|uniref:hypothetical protein n=1 Tax=unclassified Pantoea TaxID=2630326 RepID=UPI001232B632|nr:MULTISPECIES: hypothetical protein [unclassified Pantoea]KAA6093791.1 hypothetical protein F3I21_22770 [Pantoea sp. B_9]KAA6106153.1 hypothetical protein F3I18_23965 [Pantoea sp. B_10]